MKYAFGPQHIHEADEVIYMDEMQYAKFHADTTMKAFDKLPKQVREAISVTTGLLPYGDDVEKLGPYRYADLLRERYGHIIVERIKK